MGLNVAVILLLVQLPTAAAEPGWATEAARDALDRYWWRAYPWYDAETDGVKRIEPRQPLSCNLQPNWRLRLPRGLLRWAGWSVLFLLLALMAYLMHRAYRDCQRRLAGGGSGGKPGGPAADAERLEALPFPLARLPRDLLQEARQCYQRGDYSRAIVYLFSFQLVQLDKRQIIRLAKGKTNRQYLREVGPRRPLRRLLERTMVAFEDVFFGNRTLDRDRFESCWSRLSEFETLAAEGAR